MIRHFLEKIFGKNIAKKITAKILRFNVILYGNKALKIIDEEVHQMGKEYWLMFGTLLGAVREHDFIPHDSDIDVAMFSYDMKPELIQRLKKRGFRFCMIKMSSDKRYRMIKFLYHHIPVDIYGFTYDDDNSNKITGFLTKALEGINWKEAYKKNLMKVCLVHCEYEGLMDCQFNNMTLKIPKNAHDFLRKQYGEDYMTPQKGNKGATSSIMEILPLEKLSASVVGIESL